MEIINSVYTSNSVECDLKKEFELEASGDTSYSSTAVQDALEDNSKHTDPCVKEEPQQEEDQQDDDAETSDGEYPQLKDMNEEYRSDEDMEDSEITPTEPQRVQRTLEMMNQQSYALSEKREKQQNKKTSPLKILRSPAGNKLARPASEYDDDIDEDKDEESHTTTTLGSYEEDSFLTKEDVSSDDRTIQSKDFNPQKKRVKLDRNDAVKVAKLDRERSMEVDLSSESEMDSSDDEEDTDAYSYNYSTNSSIATNTCISDIETRVCDENGNRRSARIVFKMIQSTATCDKSTSTEENDNSEEVGQTFSSNSEGQFSDDYDSSDYSSSDPAGEKKISEAEIYSNESYDSDSLMNDHTMSMRIANSHKSSNDFVTNRKLKGKSFEQRRSNNNEDGRRAATARKQSGEPTSWCIS